MFTDNIRLLETYRLKKQMTKEEKIKEELDSLYHAMAHFEYEIEKKVEELHHIKKS